MEPLAPVEIDLEGCFLSRVPGDCADLLALAPSMREVQVGDVLDQLDDARTRRRAVLVRLDSPGGFASMGAELWAAFQNLRDDGIGVVALVTGVAASAAVPVLLGATYSVALPHASVVLHGGARVLAPDDLPTGPPSSLVKALGECGDPTIFRRALFSRDTLGTDAEIETWLAADATRLDAQQAQRLAFVDEVAWWSRAEEVAADYARGSPVPSPRRIRLAAAGRGDAALLPAAAGA